MSLVFYLVILLVAISMCIVAFLVVSAGDLKKFKNIHGPKARSSILPIVSRYGDLISSPQELDFHLNGLKARLREKYHELESFKSKIQNRIEHLQKFENYKKGCMEMQANLLRTEEECKALQQKIEYFKQVQVRVVEELTPGGTYMGDADWMVAATRISA